MQHNLRDPIRDHEPWPHLSHHLRGPAALKPAPIAGEPIEKLLDLLKDPEDRVRYRARIELGGRDSNEVMSPPPPWVSVSKGMRSTSTI